MEYSPYRILSNLSVLFNNGDINPDFGLPLNFFVFSVYIYVGMD